MHICTHFYCNISNSWLNISVWTKAVDLTDQQRSFKSAKKKHRRTEIYIWTSAYMIVSSGVISCLQLIRLKASIMSGHLHTDGLIRQLCYRTREGEERAISVSFPRQEGSFQTRTVRITGWGKKTRAHHLLYTETEIIPLLSLPALAAKEEVRGLFKPIPANM